MPDCAFCDHHRQRYAEKVPISEVGEFMIGDYNEDGTVGDDGEFKVALIELHGDRRWSLYPHLEHLETASARCAGRSTMACLMFSGRQ